MIIYIYSWSLAFGVNGFFSTDKTDLVFLSLSYGVIQLVCSMSDRPTVGNSRDRATSETSFDMTRFHSCDEDLCWYGCYEGSKAWKRYIADESHAHPAKMSPKLCDKIFKHLKTLGLLKKGDTVVDFMSGTGTINILASLHGFNSIAVELEPHFIKMIKANRKQMERHTRRKANWRIILGDSQQLSRFLRGKRFVGVTSPPFEDSLSDGLRDEDREKYEEWKRASASCGKKYSPNLQNIGNQQGERYLQAMLRVYQEAHGAGISCLVTVTKNPTRNGKLRRLDIDTTKLLMLAGYGIVDYHRAVLFREVRQRTLTGEVRKLAKGRLSFFKRLSYQRGNVVAHWEDIIIARRIT